MADGGVGVCGLGFMVLKMWKEEGDLLAEYDGDKDFAGEKMVELGFNIFINREAFVYVISSCQRLKEQRLFNNAG